MSKGPYGVIEMKGDKCWRVSGPTCEKVLHNGLWAEDVCQLLNAAHAAGKAEGENEPSPELVARRCDQMLNQTAIKHLRVGRCDWYKSAPPGHILTDDGTVRKVLGTLPVLKTGEVVGLEADVWYTWRRDGQVRTFRLRTAPVLTGYLDGIPESGLYEFFPEAEHSSREAAITTHGEH